MTLDAFVQLRRLGGKMAPKIDDYFALFYMLWFQPQNTRNAWVSALTVPAEINPLSEGGGKLHVNDFACGTLATLFGTLLHLGLPSMPNRESTALSVYSEDKDERMELIGWRLFDAFCAEIEDTKKYSQLTALRMACNSVQFSPLVPRDATVWLTAHNAAYQDQAVDIRNQLDALVRSIKPNGVIVSSREYKANLMFEPQPWEPYDPGVPLTLQSGWSGDFPLVDEFRGEITDFIREHALDLLGQDKYEFVPNWLETDVSWTERQNQDGSKPLALCYVRREQVMDNGSPL